MADDREWNQSFNESKENYRNLKRADDKKMIEKYADSIEKEDCDTKVEKWGITFTTKYGQSKVYYFPDNGRWAKEIGRATGKGAISMLNYFKPVSRVDGNVNKA